MNLFASYSPINHSALYAAPTSARPESNKPQLVLFNSLTTSELEQENNGVFRDLIEFAMEQRGKLRAVGKYDESDLMRNRLEQIGIFLQDLSKTTIWRRVHQEEKPQR